MGRSVLRWLLAGALVTALVGCSEESAPPPVDPPAQKTQHEFGVFGTADEVEPYRELVRSYNEGAVSTEWDLKVWPSREAMLADVDAGVKLPDVYMAARGDLPRLGEERLNMPLFELLDERGVRYGERFSRAAISAFSADDELQCVPYASSPMVLYYNTDLIDFERMAGRGLEVPEDVVADGWTFDQFRTAAEFASRPRTNARGLQVDADLRSLAPFILSGGGQIFDDDDQPTSLAFNEEDTREALTTTLEVLRDPQLTLSESQLEQRDAVEWFKRGRVGMIEGFRSLTPELREVDGLHFDVMPMPILDGEATIGDSTGMCIAEGGAFNKAADFLVHVLSDESFGVVAEAGYIVPVNELVARSEAFLQPAQQPANAGVFNASLDNMRVLPLVPESERLNAEVEPLLDELLHAPVLEDLEVLTLQIDERSRSVLDPDYVPEPSDSESDPPDED